MSLGICQVWDTMLVIITVGDFLVNNLFFQNHSLFFALLVLIFPFQPKLVSLEIFSRIQYWFCQSKMLLAVFYPEQMHPSAEITVFFHFTILKLMLLFVNKKESFKIVKFVISYLLEILHTVGRRMLDIVGVEI